MTAEEQPAHSLPPLLEKFPVDTYPLREIGTGFTAQSVSGTEANACASTAAEMLIESRTIALSMTSMCSDEGSTSSAQGVESGEQFIVPDLAEPEGAAEDGMLILRNENLFPGMVGISLPLQGVLWVREDGTFNCSGFFRRQIPKFEAAALLSASSNITEALDVYHALYRSVVERAVQMLQFKVLRTVIEAGLSHYKEDSPTRSELLDVRRRVTQLRAQTKGKSRSESWLGNEPQTDGQTSLGATEGLPDGNAAGSVGGDSVLGDEVSSVRSRPSSSGDSVDEAEGLSESSGKARIARASSDNDRPAKIAQQVVEGAPKQKEPFRLWKNKTGTEGYDRSTPS